MENKNTIIGTACIMVCIVASVMLLSSAIFHEMKACDDTCEYSGNVDVARLDCCLKRPFDENRSVTCHMGMKEGNEDIWWRTVHR